MDGINATDWGHDEDFLFTDEPDRENIAENDGVSFNNFIFLEIDIVEGEYIFGLDQKGNLTPIVEILIGTDVYLLNLEWKIVYVWLWDDWLGWLSLAVDLVLVAHQSVAPAHDETVVQDRHDYQIVLLVLKTPLWNHVWYQLTNQARLWRPDWRKSYLYVLW